MVKFRKFILVIFTAFLCLTATAQSPYYMLYVNHDTAQVGDVVKIIATDGNGLTVNCPSTTINISFESYNNGNLYNIVVGSWSSYEVNDSLVYYWTVPVGTVTGMGQFTFAAIHSCLSPMAPTFNMYIKSGISALFMCLSYFSSIFFNTKSNVCLDSWR